jgi:hypothetical protein
LRFLIHCQARRKRQIRKQLHQNICFVPFYYKTFTLYPTNIPKMYKLNQLQLSHNSSFSPTTAPGLTFSSNPPPPLPTFHFPPLKSGIPIILTTRLVHPVKCCVLCPLPVSGLYCSQAKPVSTHSSKTVLMRLTRSSE